MSTRKLVIALTALVAVLLVPVAGAVVYDTTRDDVVARGVSIGGISVGGLTREAAERRLERRLVAGLRRDIVVHHDRRTWILGPREARIATNVESSVDEAIRVSRDGNALTRTWRSLTGGRVDAEIAPQVTYSKAAVIRMLDKIRRSLERDPVDATAKLTASGIERKRSRTGLAVRASELHGEIRAAIVSPTASRRFVARTKKVQPAVTDDELASTMPVALVVNRSRFRLTLYERLKPAKTYRIAVGKVGMDTPAGEYKIQNKAINPAWHVPDSDWAGDLRGKVIPGDDPTNPIKARWMGIYDGVGIHGTDAANSIGSAASHGCIRMLIPQVEELYEKVPVGTPIYIA